MQTENANSFTLLFVLFARNVYLNAQTCYPGLASVVSLNVQKGTGLITFQLIKPLCTACRITYVSTHMSEVIVL